MTRWPPPRSFGRFPHEPTYWRAWEISREALERVARELKGVVQGCPGGETRYRDPRKAAQWSG